METLRQANNSILLVTRSEILRKRLEEQLPFKLLHVHSAEKAVKLLKRKSIPIIFSDDVYDFERLKTNFPDPIRILFVSHLDIEITQAAINQGEVFRFLLDSSSSKEISEAIVQGVHHFQIVSRHKEWMERLQKQNKELERIIQTLEKEVYHKTNRLKNIEEELYQSKRYLEQLSTLISWINASASITECQDRMNVALKSILPIERIILSSPTDEKDVKKIKELKRPTLVIPLVYQKRNLGHLYFLCRNKTAMYRLYDKLDLIKQVSDTVALTLEKIHIFDVSVKRKEEWEKTFDAIKDPVSLVNQNYDIVRANLAYSKISGMKIQNLVGSKCYKVFQKKDLPCEGCLLKEAIQERKQKNFELKSLAQDTYYATSSFPMISYDQGLAVMYYRDQGEERGLRDQLIQSEKMAEIGILAGSVAHEINNPLGGILAFTQVLLSEAPKGSSLYADLKEVENAALRAKQIVENLLYFSRASYENERENIDITLVIEKALSLVDFNIRHFNIQVQRRFSRVPFVHGDFNQLVQVFLNFFQNSVEALKKNGVVQVSTHVLKDSKKIRIEIEDNGIGVEPNEISKIFNPFFTTKNKANHAGLGLSVSYRIIRDHGGDVKVESAVGNGTKFIITLPILGEA